MSGVRIELDGGRTAYRPGEEVAGTVSWALETTPEEAAGAPPAPAEHAEVRLAWSTRGQGEEDSDVAAAVELPAPAPSDRREFRLRLPAGPYSVTGKLVSIVWAVEAVVEPGERTARVEIVVSPTGREVLLHPDAVG